MRGRLPVGPAGVGRGEQPGDVDAERRLARGGHDVAGLDAEPLRGAHRQRGLEAELPAGVSGAPGATSGDIADVATRGGRVAERHRQARTLGEPEEGRRRRCGRRRRWCSAAARGSLARHCRSSAASPPALVAGILPRRSSCSGAIGESWVVTTRSVLPATAPVTASYAPRSYPATRVRGPASTRKADRSTSSPSVRSAAHWARAVRRMRRRLIGPPRAAWPGRARPGAASAPAGAARR